MLLNKEILIGIYGSQPYLDTGAEEYFNAVVANGASINVSARTAVNNFIIGLKNDEIWNSIYDMGLFAGVTSRAGALVKVKTVLASRLLINNNFISGAYVPTGSTAGFKANGSNTYLDTQFNPSSTGTNPQSCSLTDFAFLFLLKTLKDGYNDIDFSNLNFEIQDI